MALDRDTDVTYDVSDFVAELRRLADALEAGASFTIQIDGETVAVPEDALVSIAHEREDGSVELEFQLSWEEETDEDEEEEAGEEENA